MERPRWGPMGLQLGPRQAAANKDQTPPRRGAVSRGLAQSAKKGNTKLSAEFQSLK